MMLGARTGAWLNASVPPPPPGPIVYPTADPSINVSNIQSALDGVNPGEAVYLVNGDYPIDHQIDIRGGVRLVGNGMDSTRIIQVSETTTDTTRCVKLDGGSELTGVTLTDGHSLNAGAGALVKNGKLSWCRICNSVVSNSSQAGAGVSFTGGHGTLDHCIVCNNRLGNYSWGAGVGGKTPDGDIAINCCLVYGNVNPAGSAGGIGIEAPNGITITIRQSTITDNLANTNVGGLYVNNGSNSRLVLVNNIISRNWHVSTSNESNTFLYISFLDESASSNCLITGTAANYNQNIWKDSGVKTKIRNLVDADPRFVSVSTNDFHIDSTSPARGAGVTISPSDIDLDHNEFRDLPSIGCYEAED